MAKVVTKWLNLAKLFFVPSLRKPSGNGRL